MQLPARRLDAGIRDHGTCSRTTRTATLRNFELLFPDTGATLASFAAYVANIAALGARRLGARTQRDPSHHRTGGLELIRRRSSRLVHDANITVVIMKARSELFSRCWRNPPRSRQATTGPVTDTGAVFHS